MSSDSSMKGEEADAIEGDADLCNPCLETHSTSKENRETAGVSPVAAVMSA